MVASSRIEEPPPLYKPELIEPKKKLSILQRCYKEPWVPIGEPCLQIRTWCCQVACIVTLRCAALTTFALYGLHTPYIHVRSRIQR